MFNRNSWAKYLVFTIETDSSVSVDLREAAGRPILWCKYFVVINPDDKEDNDVCCIANVS